MDQTFRTRIKICGITNPRAASEAINAGADALGLVFYEPSPRYVDIASALQVSAMAYPFVTLVGLFVNADQHKVSEILSKVPLQLLQFHGDEPREYCESFGLPYMKALRVREGIDIAAEARAYASAQAILLDTYKKGVPGGTGESFNWDLVPKLDQPVVLAGGLDSDNVRHAINEVKPYAVDTSGGVESAPGVKDPDRMRAFVEQVRQADSKPYV